MLKKFTLNWIIIFPIVGIILISTVILTFSLNSSYDMEKSYFSYLSKNLIKENKSLVKLRMTLLKERIDYQLEQIEGNLKDELKNKLQIALKIASEIYKTNIDIDTKENIKKEIIRQLSLLRFDNKEGYFYIYNPSTNTLLSHPIINLIGKDISKFKNIKNIKQSIKQINEKLSTNRFAFQEMYFLRPNYKNKIFLKLNAIVQFRPLGFNIGTGEYFDTIVSNLKEELLQEIDSINKMYVDNKISIFKVQDYENFEDLITNEKIEESLKRVLINTKKNLNGFYKHSFDGREKYSYFVYIKELDWIIENGFYLDSVNSHLDKLHNDIKGNIKNILKDSLFVIIGILILSVFISMFIMNRFKKIILEYTSEIKNKNKELETIFETSKDGIAIVDAKSNFLYFNKAYSKILGFKENSFDKKNLQIYKKFEIEKDILKKVSLEKHIQNYEKKYTISSGKKVFVNMSIALMPDNKRYLVSIKDVTKLKKDEEKISEYMNLIDENIISATIDLEGKINYVSNAFCKISKYKKEELLGKKHKLVIDEKIWNSLKKNDSWQGEFKCMKKNRESYWGDVTVSPINEDDKHIGYMIITQDITDKKRIEELSITDALTKLYNRRHFDDIFPKFLNGAKRREEFIAFVLMDIDFFKQYNDTYGHMKGDEVLESVGSCLKFNLKRADDMAFRLGGEEFGLLFKIENKEKGIFFANKLKEKIQDLKILHSGNSASEYVTVSLGMVCDYANKFSTVDEIYKQADILLYKSKDEGRNKLSYN